MSYTVCNQSYLFEYNYSDIAQRSDLSFSYKISEGRFLFSILCPDIPFGTYVELDPTYGLIADSTISTLEYDDKEGRFPDMVRLGTSQYYLIASTSDGEGDGWLFTIKVWENNGTIKNAPITKYEYDSSDGDCPSICCVSLSNDIYAVSYRDRSGAGGAKATLVTVKVWDENGSIKQSTLDTQALTYDGNYTDLVHVTGNYYAIAYTECSLLSPTYDGWMETRYINPTTGDIGLTANDTQEFNTSQANYSKMIMLDSDTVAIVFEGSGADGYLVTYNISSAGAITNTRAAEWEFDSTNGQTPNIYHISGNVYAIAYRNSSTNGCVRTCTITTAGAITKSWIDSFEFDGTDCLYPTIFHVSGNVYGITYQNTSSDGAIVTFTINSAGTIGTSRIDTMEFEAADNQWYAPIVNVGSGYTNSNYYLIVYAGPDTAGKSSYDGWSCTVSIATNLTPTITSPIPTNGSTGVELFPELEIKIDDPNGDKMTLTWSSNSNGSWQTFGTNSSCNNDTYRWTNTNFSQQNTRYWWRVNVTDGVNYNQSTFYFTTGYVNLMNCSTDKTSYNGGETVTFSAWVNGTAGKIVLLIANSTAYLLNATYTYREQCIANSSNITIEGEVSGGTEVTATMTASESTTWFAKVCNEDNTCDYTHENTTAWNKKYDDGYTTGWNDVAYSVATDTENNVYVVGYGTKLNSSGSGSDWWIMKFDEDGARLWKKNYNKESGDIAYSVCADTNNKVYVVGYGTNLNGTSTGSDWWIMRFDGATGTREWNKTYNGKGSNDVAYSVATDTNNNVYVVGSGNNLVGSTSDDWWFMKFDSSGNRLWNKSYDGGYSQSDIAYSVATDSSNNIYIAGYKKISMTQYDWWIKKFDSSGTEDTANWNNTYSTSGTTSIDWAFSVAVDNANNVYVVGINCAGDWWIKKFDSSGNDDTANWNKTYNSGSSSGYALSVTTDTVSNVYVVGYRTSPSKDWWIKKFNSTGVEDTNNWNWNLTYDGDSGADEAKSVTADTNGNIYVAGYGENLNGTGDYDWWIKKFEYITGSFTTPNKEIINKTRTTYTFEINPTGTVLYGYVNNTRVQTSIDANWHYVVLTYDGSTLTLYKDGAPRDSTALNGSIPTNSYNLTLGKNLSGWLDEVRISKNTRSSTWINTSYLNQNSPSTFLSLGSEQSVEHIYLNISVKNTGRITLKTEDFDILVNGTKIQCTCPHIYLSPDETIYFTSTTQIASGEKRIKVITDTGISEYYKYTN
jgi:archaellum component FlaF (FlaF/FlaG flagellin family)